MLYNTIFFEYFCGFHHSYVTEILPILYRLRTLQASFLSRNITVNEPSLFSFTVKIHLKVLKRFIQMLDTFLIQNVLSFTDGVKRIMGLSFIFIGGTKFEILIISGWLLKAFYVSVFCPLSENHHLAGYQFWRFGTLRQ